MNREMPPEQKFMNLSQINRAKGSLNSIRGPTSYGALDGLIDLPDWDNKPIPARQWIIDNMIPCGCVTMLTGNGGEGKSLLSLQLMVASVLGQDWLGKQVKQVKCLGIYCEDEEEELIRRLDGIISNHGVKFSDLTGLELISRKGVESIMFEAQFNDMVGHKTPFYEQVKALCMRDGYRLIVLDSLYNFFGGNENSRPMANQFIATLDAIAQDIGGAVIIVGHPSMAGINTGTGTSGSTAWHNAVRSRLYLHRRKPTEAQMAKDPGFKNPLLLEPMKGNYGPPVKPITIEYNFGRFVPINEDVDRREYPHPKPDDMTLMKEWE